MTVRKTSDLITLADAGTVLGISPDTLRVQAKKGRLVATKVAPRLWMVERSEVERYGREVAGKPGRKAAVK